MPLPMYSSAPPPPPLSQIKTVLAIAAGKGGVGKSSVTVNLAIALQRMGYRVGVMDTDIYGPSVRQMLPEDRLPAQRGEVIVPALCQGIQMISMAYFRKTHEAAAVRAPIANGVITQFIKNVAWGELDFLLIDFPPGTGDVQLTLSQQANLSAALMVTTPQEVALIDVRKAMHLFQQVRVPLLGIVENMSYYIHPGSQEKAYLFGREGGAKLSLEAGVPLLGQIPLDPAICQAGDEGFSTKTPLASAFVQLAEQVLTQISLLKMQEEEGLKEFELVWKEMSNGK